jgi:hypothetical protein
MPAHQMNMLMSKDVLRLKFDGGFSHDWIIAGYFQGRSHESPRTAGRRWAG